ncbi:thiol:disulfide oxidoreductase [Gracilibacillus boraciitolerans JCM 21714]|uniref:Thiol:disulfide oxidoreductase n=1 Tax=Gracilibacillus boraciitolerans JCM 21714 TaxID=1298598 RepID=W4VNZ4_9BACI|nr:TlpA disulfide reductase family protein [Gracilibacillus boraciitolerans]GAE94563.1 thiol:disulfide oxidoreductase [Gracilibacillus boraciitolerans JCM 21714]
MKKIIITVILLLMFGYAIFDLAKSEESDPSTKEELIDNDSASENNTSPDIKVGLEVGGDQAPDFQLQTLEEENARLSDYRGQRVMLNFWATWCPPCRAEMPDMEKFYQTKDVAILAVNLVETEANLQDVDDFVEEFGLSFSILLDENNSTATKYQIRPIPSSYMIDSNGIIRYIAYGPLNYETMESQFEKMQ